jgi:hypothetical protein
MESTKKCTQRKYFNTPIENAIINQHIITDFNVI